MRTVTVAASAEAELTVAARWYEARGPGLGSRLLQSAHDAVKRIAEAPESFPLWSPPAGFRKCPVRSFPYQVFFDVTPESVVVLAFAHAKRKPGYWLRRTAP